MNVAGRLGDVIIPAFDEASVIGRCLETLMVGLGSQEAQIIVAANGCSDDTAAIARSFGPEILVLEFSEPSKPAAIRGAEAHCASIPRLYLDADVQLSGSGARSVLEQLHQGALAARPRIRYDTSRSSWPVRSYYRARSSNDALMRRLWGAGVYGLSPAGRARFGQYPDIVAEDMWVDQHFSQDEIEIVSEAEVVVHAPRTLSGLRMVLRRAHRGAVALNNTGGFATASQGTTLRGLAAGAAKGIGPALDACVYATLAATSRVDVRMTRTRGWERDETSRVEQ